MEGLDKVDVELGDWLEALRTALGAESARLWVRDGKASQLVMRLQAPSGSVMSDGPGIPLRGHALGWVVTEGVTVRASRQDVFREDADGWVVAAPVAGSGGERIACVALDFDHAPGPHAPRTLELAASLAGRLIDDARATVGALRDLRKYEALYESIFDLDRELNLEGLAESVCQRALKVCEARGGAVALWDGGLASGRIIAVGGTVPARLRGVRLDGGSSFLGLALSNGTELPRDDLKAGERFPLYAGDIGSDAGSAIIVPMRVEGIPIGGIAVEFEGPRGFSEADLRRLGALARFVAPSFRNAAEFGEVEARSLTDALTGLPNRRASERALASTAAAAERSRGAFGVALLDVDHFKNFNDRHGHDAGDRVLQTVARVVRDSLRPGDIAGRWGGEEFLVVLPSTRLDDAARVVERIRASVERAGVVWDGRALRVTLSAGVSAYPEVVPNPAGLVASADAALYQAKRRGRNLVARARPGGRERG